MLGRVSPKSRSSISKELSREKRNRFWRELLGYHVGEKLRLKVSYAVPKVDKGEIGVIESFWSADDSDLGYCFTLMFSGNRELVVFSDEVEDVV